MKNRIIEQVCSLYANRPKWITGYIGLEDTVFLAEMLALRFNGPVVELGVASGCSSAILLDLLSHDPPSEGVWLHSYDISKKCYFDKNRLTGQAVAEMVPGLRQHWLFHVGIATDIARDFPKESIEFAFIDADHRHPWPTLDLIAILPQLAPNAWVALHDINLPAITTNPKWKVYGPKYLFDAWPWDKRIAEGHQKNIGAVRVPSSRTDVLDFLKTLIKLKWEARVSDELLTKLAVPQ